MNVLYTYECSFIRRIIIKKHWSQSLEKADNFEN